MTMRVLLLGIAALAATACTANPLVPDAARIMPLPAPEYVAPAPQQLAATTLREYAAEEADQGVAVDAQSFYAIDNSVIARYRLSDGALLARWVGPAHGLIRHMNSCYAAGGRLYCANSNYSQTPMGSSVEIFDAKTLEHVDSHSLGLTDEGSLTFFFPWRSGWMAGFAHYDENGGLKFKDHTFSGVVAYDSAWRRTGGWMFPASVMERMAPYAASGGALGPDGLLYVLGHDRPEMYVLARPAMGPTLIHVATISLEAEGQAFAWAPAGRSIYAIDRRKLKVRAIDLPPVSLDGFLDARSF